MKRASADRLKVAFVRSVTLQLAGLAAAAGMLGGCVSGETTTLKKPAGTDQYVRAVNDLKTGNQDAAIAELEQAIIVNPSLRMARMTLGELYIERKEFEKAVPHLQVASELDPYTLRNHYNLGLSLQVLNRLQESALAYLRGLELYPEDFKSNMNLGLVYFALNQLDPAIYYLERASRTEPGNSKAWSNIGVVYDARGNMVLAEASYRKSLELDPTSESTLINLTANLLSQRKSADAVAIAGQLVKVAPSALSYKRLGDAHTAASEWEPAASAYDQALAIDANFVPALNAKAEMFVVQYEANLRLDDALREKALAAWRESLRLASDQPNVTANIARYADTKVFK